MYIAVGNVQVVPINVWFLMMFNNHSWKCDTVQPQLAILAPRGYGTESWSCTYFSECA